MPVQLITPPTVEPVTIQEAKDHLRLQIALDDDYVASLIETARSYIEEVCWRGLLKQTWELVLESFAGEDSLELGTRGRRYGSGIGSFTELPRGNLSSSGFLPYIVLPKGNLWVDPAAILPSVSSIKYTDANGALQTLDPAGYTVDRGDGPVPGACGKVRLAYGAYWPATRWPQFDAVRIRYTVGWDTPAAIPAPIKHAMKLLISQLYEHRSPEVIARGIVQINFSADALLAPYRLNRGL